MRLLVSVSTIEEAEAVITGGADIVDAKDPSRGALEPVSPGRLAELAGVCRGRAPLSAALGDDGDIERLVRMAALGAHLGLSFVKVGFPPAASVADVRIMLDAVQRGAGAEPTRPHVVAAAYADVPGASDRVLEAAASAGVHGVLLDTADKSGPGVWDRLGAAGLRQWITRARSMRLEVAVAGRLTADHLGALKDLHPDIAGVRGAACEGGRTGTVSASRVSMLQGYCAGVRRPESPSDGVLAEARG